METPNNVTGKVDVSEKIQNQDAATQSSISDNDKALIEFYVHNLKKKIRQNINIPISIEGRLQVIYKLNLLPSGELSALTLVKSSGNLDYDNAVNKSIQRAVPFSLPSDPSLYSNFKVLILPIAYEK